MRTMTLLLSKNPPIHRHFLLSLTTILILVLLPTHSLPLKPSSSSSPPITLIPTTTPPLLDVPTYSLATTTASSSTSTTPNNNNNNNNNDKENPTTTTTTTMNILTYATPIGISPQRTWAISLYKQTQSYENFKRNRFGILQLLTKKHVSLVRYLGGTSGKNVDKEQLCKDLGIPWQTWVDIECNEKEKKDEEEERVLLLPKILPYCKSYLLLSQQGDLIDIGSHCVAICKVERMLISDDDDDDDDDDETIDHDGDGKEEREEEEKEEVLSTAYLRQLGLITHQGRVADPPFTDD